MERLDPALNAIVQKDAASAWRAAASSDARVAPCVARPLEGLPVTIKDCFEVAGMVTSAGAPAPKIISRTKMRARWLGCAAPERSARQDQFSNSHRRLPGLQRHLRDEAQSEPACD
jgi:Amidase